ncbi:LOW QUALITY PROTEIN: putative secreted lipase [Paramyrothecium foliicola]|nr:LOW QUALITY PROTEIN: putative secreted lipase [Paramyrothecium foliicola]
MRDRIVFSIARSADISEGFYNISARAFADGVNKTCWWLEGLVGRSKSFETVAYIGPQGALNIIRATECRLWVHPEGLPREPLLDQVQQECEMMALEMPQLDQLLDTDAVKHYPYSKSFDEAIAEPFCVLHSSGSTGLPKTIKITHGLVGSVDAVQLLPSTEGDHGLTPWSNLFKKGSRLYCPNVLLHVRLYKTTSRFGGFTNHLEASAIIVDLLCTFFFETQCVMGPVGVTPDTSLFSSLADHGNINIWFVLPQYLNQIGQTPEVLSKLATADFLAVAGGPFSPETAAKVNEVVRVFNMTGTTEGFMTGNLFVNQEDFLHFAFHPYSGFEFREVEPGVFQHWVVRNERWSLFQGIFHTFPQLQEVNLKDLYIKHPTKAGHWLYWGRSDDLIALTDGTKIFPSDMEATISAHPAIKGCIMVGAGQRLPALLLELNEPRPKGPEALEQFCKDIQGQMSKADASAVFKGYLHNDRVIFTDPERPFPSSRIPTQAKALRSRATFQCRPRLKIAGNIPMQATAIRWKDHDEIIFFTISLTNALAQNTGQTTPASPSSNETDTVEVILPLGTVVGKVTTVESFRGIPFADAPEGELRFRPPQRRTKPWGVLNATIPGPSCPQFVDPGEELLRASENIGVPTVSQNPVLFAQREIGQEDCLTLNIQRPKGTKEGDNLPVFFYIFGGGFAFGSANMIDATSFLEYSELRDQKFIYVGVNYRVAGFGFMPGAEILEEGSANAGLLDQRMGLEWVADNIAFFGGNPANVTISGSSSGSISTFDQLVLFNGNASYKGNALFHGAIMVSGMATPIEPLDSPKAQAIFEAVAAHANCTIHKLACLRSKDFATLHRAIISVPSIHGYTSLALSYLPRPDGVVLADSPERLAKNGQMHLVPMITGNNEDEGTFFAQVQRNVTDTDALVGYLADFYFSKAPEAKIREFVETYPEDPSKGSPFRTGKSWQWLYGILEQRLGYKRNAALLGDIVFTLARRLSTEAILEKQNATIWAFQASWSYSLLNPVGTHHGSDMFKLFFEKDLEAFASASIRTYFLNFIHRLDPNGGEDIGDSSSDSFFKAPAAVYT